MLPTFRCQNPSNEEITFVRRYKRILGFVHMKSSHPFSQLLIARLREFYREPEAIFWVYGFPLIMALGLGIAFWNRKPEPIQVDIAEGPGAGEIKKELNAAEIKAEIHSEAECA